MRPVRKIFNALENQQPGKGGSRSVCESTLYQQREPSPRVWGGSTHRAGCLAKSSPALGLLWCLCFESSLPPDNILRKASLSLARSDVGWVHLKHYINIK